MHNRIAKDGHDVTSACVQMLWGERRGHGIIDPIQRLPMELPMSQHCHFDASRSLTALEQDSTIIAVIEMSQTKWLVAALIPGDGFWLARWLRAREIEVYVIHP